MKSLESKQDLSRLQSSLDWSRWKLQGFRTRRLRALQQFVGYNYSEWGSEARVPLNVINLAVLIYLRQLAPRSPSAKVTTKSQVLLPLAADMQSWMRDAIEKMDLHAELAKWVLDALFCLGVLKVGEASKGTLEIQGEHMQLGQAFARTVDLDDFVIDMQAKRLDDVDFIGNRYEVPLDEARENKRWKKSVRERLEPTLPTLYNERGDMRSIVLTQGTSSAGFELRDRVMVWDLFFPKEGKLVTLKAGDGSVVASEILEEMKWTGPTCGPYHLLSYADVPNNLVPVSPVMNLIDLHLLINTIWRKIGEQGERSKTILIVDGRASKDAENVRDASDGEIIKAARPEAMKEVKFGGADQSLMALGEQLRMLFDFMAGNLSTQGGLGAGAPTLGQDKMLAQQTSAQMGDMRDRTMKSIRGVYKSLAFHWWQNPVETYTSVRTIEGVQAPVVIPPAMRRIPFEALDFDVDPFSMQHDSPQEAVAKLMQVVQQMLVPLGPMLAQQGLQTDWARLFGILGEYMALPELAQVLRQAPKPEEDGTMGDEIEKAPKAGQTERRYVRENRSTMTDQGRSKVMQQLLASAGQQAGGA